MAWSMPVLPGDVGWRGSTPPRPAPIPARRDGTWLAPLLVGLGVYCLAVAGARGLLNDGDTLSHIALRRWIIEHRAIPFHDPFSYTFRDQT